jgi:predicted Fe-S protein YdhL (DUF1289 family)
MTRLLLAASLAAVMAAMPLTGFAQTGDKERREAARAKWESMSPEEKEAAKAKARERWDSMSPEEQAAAKKRFAERHPAAGQRRAGAATAPGTAPPTAAPASAAAPN